MLMAYSRYWAPLFSPPLTSPKMFGNVLHPDPYSGRVRQRTCQVLFKNNLQPDDKNEPARNIALPLS